MPGAAPRSERSLTGVDRRGRPAAVSVPAQRLAPHDPWTLRTARHARPSPLSPPAAIVPMTSGLVEAARVMKVEKLSLGNGVGSASTTAPPAASIAVVKVSAMSCPNA